MKKQSFAHQCELGFILSAFLIGNALLFTPLQAQDQATNKPADSTQALIASSSAADVEALATKIAQGITAPISNNSPDLAPFAAVDHKVLIAVSAKFDPQSSGTKGKLLHQAILKYATPDDIPDLLATNNNSLIFVIGHRNWWSDPHVTSAVLTVFQSYQSATAFQREAIPIATYMALASGNHDPKIQQAFDDMLHQVADDPKVPEKVLHGMLGLCIDSAHPDKTDILMGNIAVNLFSREDPAGTRYLIGQLDTEHGLRLKKNTFLDQAVAAYFAGNPKLPVSPYNLIVPAIFGNSDALAKAVQLYNQSTDETTKSLIKTDLFDQITYTGTGNKLDDLRDHVKDAIYQNHVWTLTMTGSTPPAATTK